MKAVIAITLLSLLAISAWELKTLGNKIVNASTNARVKLRCANWYGGHLQNKVPIGLERQTPDAIAEISAAMGINCIRLTMCARTVLENPEIEAQFLLNNETGTRYLDVIDRVIASLTKYQIMTIPNIHTLEANWVNGGASTPPQGLWNNPSFPTSLWLQSISTIAQRYADNDYVVAIDIYNEIHDTPNVTITWSDEFYNFSDSDWKRASSLAYSEMFKVNPKLIVIVCAMCMGYDIRGMTGVNIGPIQAYENKKLVYSTHFYPWTAWWTNENFDWSIIFIVTIVLIVAMIVCIFIGFIKANDIRKYIENNPDNIQYDPNHTFISEYYHDISPLFCGLFVYFTIWACVLQTWSSVANSIGCSTIAYETFPAFIGTTVSAAVSFIVFVYTYVYRRRHKMFIIVNSLFWLAILTIVHASILNKLSEDTKTYEMFEHEIGRWMVKDLSLPIFVGEFGTAVMFTNETGYRTEVSNRQWDYMTRYLRENDLDWAYWALNGRKYIYGEWNCEGFGLLNQNASGVTNATFIKNLFNTVVDPKYIDRNPLRC